MMAWKSACEHGAMTSDRIVALIGLVMALILVSRNGALRRAGWPARMQMALIWGVIILLVVVTYNWLHAR